MLRQANIFDAHQRARFMRPDASRYLRPDAARWARAVHTDERKYSPTQPRDERGRWTDTGGGARGSGAVSASPMGQINFGDLPNFSDLFGLFQISPAADASDGTQFAGDSGKPLLDSFGEPYYAPGGHHELPQSVFKKWDLPGETARVFDQATTGKLPFGRHELDGALKGHQWDEAHREYNDAIRELSGRFLKDRDIDPSQMTPEQASDLLKEV